VDLSANSDEVVDKEEVEEGEENSEELKELDYLVKLVHSKDKEAGGKEDLPRGIEKETNKRKRKRPNDRILFDLENDNDIESFVLKDVPKTKKKTAKG